MSINRIEKHSRSRFPKNRVAPSTASSSEPSGVAAFRKRNSNAFVCLIFALSILQAFANSSLGMTFYSDGLRDEGGSGSCSVAGTVLNRESGAPIPNAVVTVGDRYTLSNDDGGFSVNNLDPGVYKFTATREGYDQVLETLSLDSGEERVSIKLVPELEDAVAICRVTDAETGAAIEKAWVTIGSRTGVTDRKGYVRVERIPLTEGNELMAGAYGYMTYSRLLSLEKGYMKIDVFLKKPGPDDRALEPLKNASRGEGPVTGPSLRRGSGRQSEVRQGGIAPKRAPAPDSSRTPRGVSTPEGPRQDFALMREPQLFTSVTGTTGLFSMPTSEVLPRGHVTMGVSTIGLPHVENGIERSATTTAYKIACGALDNLELGMAVMDRDIRAANGGETSSSSRVLNLKYRLPASAGAMDLAFGYQRINVGDTTDETIDSFYVAGDYPLLTRLMESRLSANVMFSDMKDGSLTRLSLGMESRLNTWTKPLYLIMEAEQNTDNRFGILNLGFRYKKNPAFDIYLGNDLANGATSLGGGVNVRF